MVKIAVDDIRICAICGSNETRLTDRGYPHWLRHGIGRWLCFRCYQRSINAPKWNKINQPKCLYFKGRHLLLKTILRKGLCSKCGKNGKTHLHHEEYDDSNPLAHTIELCASCHMNESIRLGQIKRPPKQRFNRVCFVCGSTETYYSVKKDCYYWYFDEQKMPICYLCYGKKRTSSSS